LSAAIANQRGEVFWRPGVPPTVFDLIEFRAFSSIWYWLLLGLVWTRVIHAPMGVPYDLLRRADNRDRQAERDVQALTGYELRRRGDVADQIGFWSVALWAFALTALALLSAAYRVEMAQAVLLLAAPLALVQGLVSRAGRRIEMEGLHGADLRRALRRLRAQVQAVGLLSVFVAALWGMYAMLNAQAL